MFERKLDCGLTLVGDRIPHMRSATIGVWVAAGSTTETAETNGISHFLEHMMFKGTTHRTARQISIDVDNIGGQMNAFTTKEATAYYIRVMDRNLLEGIDILTDLVCNATLPADELEKERGVILEEIAMANDLPDDLVMDLIAKVYFSGTSLSRTILGPSENIQRFTRDDLLSYIDELYTADNMVVSIAGNFDLDEVTDHLNERMRGISRKPAKRPATADTSGFRPHGPECAFTMRDIEQVHMAFGFPAVSMLSLKERYALAALNEVIGGSMSSRLFQKVREDMGLAYTVNSVPMLYTGTGMFCVYAGTLARNAQTVTEVIFEELEKIRLHGITDAEFEQTKRIFRGNYILQMEFTGARMNQLAKSRLLLGRLMSEDDVLDYVDNVTRDEVAEQIALVTDPDRVSAAYVGMPENSEALSAVVESYSSLRG